MHVRSFAVAKMKRMKLYSTYMRASAVQCEAELQHLFSVFGSCCKLRVGRHQNVKYWQRWKNF